MFQIIMPVWLVLNLVLVVATSEFIANTSRSLKYNKEETISLRPLILAFFSLEKPLRTCNGFSV